MMMAITQAKIGRSMKNFGSMAYFLSSLGLAGVPGAGAAAGFPAAGGPAMSGAPGVHGSGLTRPRLQQTIYDDLFADLEAVGYDEVAAGHRAGLDRPRHHLAFCIDHHHGLALRPPLDRALGNPDSLIQLGLWEANADKGSGQKLAARIGKLGAQHDGAAVGVHREVGELEAALFRIEGTVLEHQRDFCRVGLLLFAALDGLLQAQHVGVGLRELDTNRVELFYRHQMRRLALAHERAFGNQRTADATGNRRRRNGIFKIQLGPGRCRFGLFDAGLGGIEFLLADSLDVEQRLVSGEHRLRRSKVGGSGSRLGQIAARIDAEQRRSGGNVGALSEQAFLHHPFDASPHLRGAHRLHAARKIL
jgi:hypothetical protein